MQETTGKPASKLDELRGKKIVSASSSLQNFSVELEDGVGLRVDAIMDDDQPKLKLDVIPSADLPKQTEAVCSVDWNWIYSSAVKQVAANASVLRFELDAAGPLVVSSGVWQGKPFLSFQPYKAPVK